ncbi:hypothetical protein LTR81_020570 [Elasticomyces elasticus]
MKSGHRRDMLIKEDNVIGFEMEGAGAWEVLPTIVVKGVVDYADSHKNKQWRGYPAARAALCAAAMIEEIDLPDRPQVALIEHAVVITGNRRTSDPTRKVQPPQIIPHRMAHTQYTGYEHLLEELECHIPLTKPKQDYQTKFVLVGMGGIGKSEMVLQLIKKNRSILDDRDRLARLITPALLVFDNCDDESVDYGSYIPDNLLVTVVLTTRLWAARKHASHDLQEPVKEHFMHLEGLEPSSAINLLMKVSGTSRDDHEDDKMAGKIVASLGFHPLAINVAASAIHERIYSVQEYAGVLARQLMDEDVLAQKINATFNVSAKALATSSDPSARDALALLNILAFMHHQGVSEDIFERAWTYEELVLSWFKDYEVDVLSWYDDHDGDADGSQSIATLSPWHVRNCRRFLGSHPPEKRMHAFRTARAHLLRLSLITCSGDKNSISLHLLISAWAKDRIPHPYEAWLQVACILVLSIQGRQGWTLFSSQLQPHLVVTLSSFPSWLGQVIPRSHRRQLCRIWAAYTWQLYRVKSPQMLQCCQQLVKQTLALSDEGPIEEQLAKAQHLMGLIYAHNGQFSKALGPLKRVLRLRQSLPEDDPSLLSAQHTLATTYRRMGQVVKAIAMLELVVRVQKTFSKASSDSLGSMHALALAYFENGQVAQALELLEYVVRVREERLRDDHPYRLSSQYDLARTYLEDGQVAQAVKLLEHVVRVREKSLVEDDPSRLASQHELAGAYLEDKQVELAIELFEHVVRVRERSLAEDHPRRLSSQHLLASAYLDSGQVARAVELLEHVVRVRERSLTEDHPSRLVSQHELARAYLDNGQVVQAVELFEHVVRVRESLAEDHPSRLASQHELARAYLGKGQVELAMKLLQHLVRVQERSLAQDHPERLMSQYELAFAYLKDGQVLRAVELLEHVVRLRERSLAEGHVERLESEHELGRAYWRIGRHREAVELIEHVVSFDRINLEADHPDRVTSESLLAKIQQEMTELELDAITEASTHAPREDVSAGEKIEESGDATGDAEASNQD